MNDPEQVEIAVFTLGPWQTNCYVVTAPGAKEASGGKSGGKRGGENNGEGNGEGGSEGPSAGRECWIVDASFGPGPIFSFIREHQLRPTALILTHAHVDHIAGVTPLLADLAKAGLPRPPLLIHAAETEWLADPLLNLSAMSGMEVTTRMPDRTIAHGEVLTLGSSKWTVLHTPGHSPGSIGLHNAEEQVVIAGDALFNGSVGRTDLPGGDPQTLARSIRTMLYTLPAQTQVLPGHGPATTIGQEKKSNPFVRG